MRVSPDGVNVACLYCVLKAIRPTRPLYCRQCFVLFAGEMVKNKEILDLQAHMDKQFEELRESLNITGADVSAIKKGQEKLTSLIKRVKWLEEVNKEKDTMIAKLESRVDDLEQYSRMNDVIVSGLKIKPRSFAAAAAAGVEGRGEPDDREITSVEQQVIDFLQTKEINVNARDIEACHPLRPSPKMIQDKKPASIILRFVNRKSKVSLMKQGKKLKDTQVYLNEHLTKANAEIAMKARQLRRDKKIQSTWTRHCRVYIQLNGPPEQAKVMIIRKVEELENING